MSEKPSIPLEDDDHLDNNLHSESPEEVHWEEVATTAGMTPAQILVGRLRSEGVPARAWQQGAGQAIGLIVGPMGTAHVVVPKEFVDQAMEILADVDDSPFEDDKFEDDDFPFEDDESAIED